MNKYNISEQEINYYNDYSNISSNQNSFRNNMINISK